MGLSISPLLNAGELDCLNTIDDTYLVTVGFSLSDQYLAN